MNLNKFLNLDYLKENPLCGIDTNKDGLNLATGECTRKIKKLVLTGEETGWVKWNDNAQHSWKLAMPLSQDTRGISSHYISIAANEIDIKTGVYVRASYIVIITDLSFSDLDNFKAFLRQQYATGTPVTVWYVLATPTTETITVPSGLSGIVEGSLTQSTTPTPTNPIYPTANNAEGWYPFNYYIMDIATDTLPQLPSTIYPTNTYLNVELEGNTEQNGTPSPSSPVDVNGVGDESDVTGFIVTTTINDITTTEVIARGDAYSKTAPTISGKTFNYWTDGTQIVSYNSLLGCIITENIHYTAIYSDSTVTKEDVMLLSMEKSTYNNMDAVACVLNTHILSGTDVTEIGIKFATNKQLGYDSSYGSDYATVNLMELQGWDVYSLLQTLGSERPSDFTNINTRYSFSVGVSTTHQAYLYFIGYYKYNDNGTIKTVYSNYAVGACYDTALTPGVPTTHYNIPITCSNITYNRYLSETESIRYIKKLVLDGTEDIWVKSTTYEGSFYSTTWVSSSVRNIGLCTHLPFVSGTYTKGSFTIGSNALNVWFPQFDVNTTIQDLKSYLAQQYANGTPVTVWYVLSTPETSTINEPLMKIGNYTDKINTTIPTKGTTEITVNTTIQPSNISVDGFQNMEIGLKGNTIQSGTPTPSTPIQPQGTGDKTANLFDKDNTTIYNAYFAENGSWNPSTDSRSILIPVSPNTEYTLSISSSSPIFRIYETTLDNPQPYSQFQVIVRTTDISSYTFTTGSNTKYIGFQGSGVLVDDWLNSLMLNLGSTALPFEPNGYKIPILSANTTTPVYLGEVQSTRQIKKYEFTGNETFDASGSGYIVNISDAIGVALNVVADAICSHYQTQTYSDIYNGSKFGFAQRLGSTNNNHGFAFSKGDYATSQDFTNYLAQQYANGTPVCVWYVLANPTTGIVNEPLMKIGGYADEVSGITITTIAGANTLDVQTTLKPSEVTANFNGWHPVTAAHERSGGQWD